MARNQHAFDLDAELAEGLTTVKVERGIPKSEQVRRAIRMWLESEGVLKPQKRAKRKRRQEDEIDRRRSEKRDVDLLEQDQRPSPQPRHRLG